VSPGCEVLLTVCLYVCLSVCSHISRKQHVQISLDFLYVLPVSVAQCYSDDGVISYVLPVSWMTSYFHTVERMVHNDVSHKTMHMFRRDCQVAVPGAKAVSLTASC